MSQEKTPGPSPSRRPPMRRTTSLTEFSFNALGAPGGSSGGGGLDRKVASPVVIQRRNSADSMENSSFLRACSLCDRQLVPGRDIYMYRGDNPYCSSECRQQQMNRDEKKEKRALISSKKEANPSSSTTKTNVSTTVETVAAL